MVSMKTWLITDTHFNHMKLLEYGRPADFEQRIFDSCVDKIRPGDLVIHLGDILIGKDSETHLRWVDPLVTGIGANWILVRGNHDKKSDTWYLERGWKFVCKEFVNEYFGTFIRFSHKPRPKPWKGHVGPDMNIHGHFHDSDHRKDESSMFYDYDYHKLLALEYEGYGPILLETFLEKYKENPGAASFPPFQKES